MRYLAGRCFIGAAALLAVAWIPAPVNAFFWSGPGCFAASLLGMGSAGGGLHFSVGGGARGTGPGPGHGYHPGYRPPPGAPHPYARPAPLMSPPSPYAPLSPSHRGQDIIEGNTWRGATKDRQPFETGSGIPAPQNLWRQ
ncbi:MAG: hypothetical protein EA347_05260 [Thioalkalivibrio sp.]|nr:MAG: hypothetical protein EA347_05260 [Thioalkalivibrio sp.]